MTNVAWNIMKAKHIVILCLFGLVIEELTGELLLERLNNNGKEKQWTVESDKKVSLPHEGRKMGGASGKDISFNMCHLDT